MPEHARYTTADLIRLADDRGPFFADNARQALRWAARTLEAADAAVQSERLRAERAEDLAKQYARTPKPCPSPPPNCAHSRTERCTAPILKR